MTAMLFLAGVGFGCWAGARDAKKKRNGWRYYSPSTNPLRDYK